MKLHQVNFEPRSTATRLVLAYKGITYDVVELNPLTAKRTLRTLSGTTNAPTLTVGDVVLTELDAIATYLDATHPNGPKLFPSAPAAQGRAAVWVGWAMEGLATDIDLCWRDAVRKSATMAAKHIPPRGHVVFDGLGPRVVPWLAGVRGLDRRAVAAAWRRMNTRLGAVEAIIAEADTLVGTELSVADIAVAGCLVVANQVDDWREERRWDRLFQWSEGIAARCGRR